MKRFSKENSETRRNHYDPLNEIPWKTKTNKFQALRNGRSLSILSRLNRIIGKVSWSERISSVAFIIAEREKRQKRGSLFRPVASSFGSQYARQVRMNEGEGSVMINLSGVHKASRISILPMEWNVVDRIR